MRYASFHRPKKRAELQNTVHLISISAEIFKALPPFEKNPEKGAINKEEPRSVSAPGPRDGIGFREEEELDSPIP